MACEQQTFTALSVEVKVQGQGSNVGGMGAFFWAAVFSLSLHVEEAMRELSRASSLRALILFMRLCPYDLIPSQGPPLLIPSHWALGFQHLNSGATRTSRLQQAHREGSTGNQIDNSRHSPLVEPNQASFIPPAITYENTCVPPIPGLSSPSCT